MPSQEMQDVIDGLRDQQKASASQASPTLEQRRAAFAPAGRLHPVPDDVMVTEVTAGGVPAHWLAAPGADTGRVLMFLHGGGFQMGSLRSDGELAARLGRAAGMRVLFPEYRLAPEDPFPAAVDDALTAWHWLRTDQDLPAASLAVAGDSAGLITGGVVLAALAVAYGLRGRRGASRSRRAAVLGSATGISWGFMAAVIKELSSHLSDGIEALVTSWSLYLLLAAGAATMLLAAHALASGPLAASQPGFTILDPPCPAPPVLASAASPSRRLPVTAGRP